MPDITNDPARRPMDERPRRDEGMPSDAGRTSGGGSLGHDQPEEVRRDTPLRNADDPVMPADDATLKTKI